MLLELENLCITANKIPLVKNLSLKLNEAQITGISAPTGSGKTTLLNFICGILNSKDFIVSGKIIKNVSDISYVFQEPRLIENESVVKNIMLPLENVFIK